ncbi:MAG: radical SAM family heme chaperone HemW [Actinobacteria bacterium]|nr:radical SAM family heme chaperone HemW [Actinomycetota bacterium]
MNFGVYLHIPFCARRCDYCAFATWTDRHHLMHGYADALRADISGAVAAGMPAATSVFFGGGTPSLLPAEQLVAVLGAIPRTADAEVTVECNPENVTAPLLAAYRGAGVNRISLGVQSMVPHVLRALGRAHHADAVPRTVGLIQAAGFESFSVDLIHGAVGESLDDWTATLTRALDLDPPHLSAYALTVEAGTPLASDPARFPDDDDQADKYVVADALLAQRGLANYEISNWARPGHECRHNLLYWSQGDYRGFGAAAHSHVDGRRFWNVRTPERYIDAVASRRSPVAGEERLDDDARRMEGLVLSLRTRRGVPAASLDVDALDEGLVAPTGDGERVALTRRGRLLANEVALRVS